VGDGSGVGVFVGVFVGVVDGAGVLDGAFVGETRLAEPVGSPLEGVAAASEGVEFSLVAGRSVVAVLAAGLGSRGTLRAKTMRTSPRIPAATSTQGEMEPRFRFCIRSYWRRQVGRTT
jgi:hypothetical protein